MLSDSFVLLTGCSCGGKSTLIRTLGKLGFATIPEPGRRIVSEEIAGDGKALPWVDTRAFAQRAIEMAQSDLKSADPSEGLVFFDRGLIDAAVALECAGGQAAREILGGKRPYAKKVFVVPPWRELFARDEERRHDFSMAVQEYHRINRALDDLGYTKRELPRVPVSERVDMILHECGAL
ncbi:putative ATPase [Labrenzia sp. EL_208]|nr:putative ATPase [Labrenzia sp. EL_132]MBG6231762.1 putative ATPase [Labrenzia sp. EL_208]MCR9060592.1 AAA family ATPase [Paracoccaceae bacterium]